jgi:hypothetical protein
MIQVLNEISIDALSNAYNSIPDSIQWTEFGQKGKQLGLQYRVGENPESSAVGSIKENEESFSLIPKWCQSTIFEDIILEYSLHRTRLMWLSPFSCYSMHRDPTPRIHIPIITNEFCYFVFRDQLPMHLPVGSVYHVDTRNAHTFINCSSVARLHLIGVVTK